MNGAKARVGQQAKSRFTEVALDGSRLFTINTPLFIYDNELSIARVDQLDA